MTKPTKEEIDAAFDKMVMQPLKEMPGASLGEFAKSGGFASGGFISAGKPYLVGENSPYSCMARLPTKDD